MVRTDGRPLSTDPSLECGALSPLWPAAAWRRFLSTGRDLVVVRVAPRAATGRSRPKRRQGGALQGDSLSTVLFVTPQAKACTLYACSFSVPNAGWLVAHLTAHSRCVVCKLDSDDESDQWRLPDHDQWLHARLGIAARPLMLKSGALCRRATFVDGRLLGVRCLSALWPAAASRRFGRA